VKHSIVVDTGPLLALIDERDLHHQWVRSQFADIQPPLVTCEPVLTEACFLAQRQLGKTDSVWGLFDYGVVRLAFSLEEHCDEVCALMYRYANVPMSLADACLVRMSERIAGCSVFTLDSDFRIYRRNRRQNIPLWIPPDV